MNVQIFLQKLDFSNSLQDHKISHSGWTFFNLGKGEGKGKLNGIPSFNHTIKEGLNQLSHLLTPL